MEYDLKELCQPKIDHIKMAGLMVGIDFKSPIDLSKMNVNYASANPTYSEFGCGKWERTSELSTQVINEYGEPEELTITFVLKSNRKPKTDGI